MTSGIMKKILFTSIVLLIVSSFSGLIAQDYLPDQDFLVSDASAFRIQSKFVGGIAFSIAPSNTVEDLSLTPTSFSFKAGYKVNSISVSGLFGIEYLNGENFIPVGMEIRNTFSNKKWAPFAYLQGGYSLHLKRNIHSRYFTANYAQYNPSFFAGAGVGYSFVTSLSEFYFSLGYLYHELESVVVTQTGEERTDLTMNGVSITMGFNF